MNKYTDNPEDTKGSDRLDVLLLFVYIGAVGCLVAVIFLLLLTS